MTVSPDPFFVGWTKQPPKASQGFLAAAAAVALVADFTIAGALVGAS